MAKARDIPGLSADVAFREAAARTVAVRARELFDQAAGVLDVDDIERVHDMRVATRRLRAVLEIYGACFDAKAHRSVLRDVKTLADALGERRDPDVQIDALEQLGGAFDAADRPGVEHLRATLRGRQATGNEALAVALRRAAETDLPGRLRELVAGADPSIEPPTGTLVA